MFRTLLGKDMTSAKVLINQLSIRAARLLQKRFLADVRGTTAIEFAMISVPFFGLIGAIFETGSVYFRNAQLQLTAESASRAVLTHSTAANITYQQFIDNNVCTWQASGTVKPGTLSKMFDCSQIMVDIRSPANWGASDMTNDVYNAPNPRSAVINMPVAGQIAIVRILYPTTVLLGMLGGSNITGSSFTQIRKGQTSYSGAWTWMLMGVAAFRVEP